MEVTDFTVFDLETTGLDVEQDRICQFGAAVYAGGEFVSRGNALINPGVHIPDGAREVHGIGDEDVEGKPGFGDLIERITGALDKAPLIVGYNCLGYDIPLLEAELGRAGSDWRVDRSKVVDVKTFVDWHHRGERPRKLEVIAPGLYGINPAGGAAHTAAVDSQMTGDLLLAMMDRGLVPRDMGEVLRLHALYHERVEGEFKAYSYWLYQCRENGTMRMGAGKHCGTAIEDVPRGSLGYLCNKIDDLPAPVREIFEAVRDGRFQAVAQSSMVKNPEPEAEAEPGWGGWDD